MDSESSAQGHDAQALRDSALCMPLQSRQDLALALLWSLPRDDVISLNKRITSLLQKDIVGALPPELSLQVLVHLSLSDLTACASVSRKWAKLTNDQALWSRLCARHDPPIIPSHPTWADVSLQRQLLHLAQQQSSVPQHVDEGGNESGQDDPDLMDPVSGAGGMGGGGGVDPLEFTGGVRRKVWEWTARSNDGLPLNFRTATDPFARQGGTSSAGTEPALAAFREPPIESHLALPTSAPSVNYKHLYIAYTNIQRRFRSYPFSPQAPNVPPPRPSVPMTSASRPRATFRLRRQAVDAIDSIQTGGLPGHSEAVYSLDLIHERMSIMMTQPRSASQNDLSFESQSNLATLKSGNGMGLATLRGPHRDRTANDPLVFSGREWLLSGSRDQTMRLWQLSAPRPRVVKVFHSGHTSSVLSHFVGRIPVHSDSDDTSPGRKREATFERLSPRKGKDVQGHRLVAVSGGSDGRICLWDIEHGDGTPENVVQAHTGGVLCVRGNDEYIVSCSKDRTIKVFDINTLKLQLVIGAGEDNHPQLGPVNAVGISKDYVISASGDRNLRVWCIRTGALLASLEAHRGIASIAFDASGKPPPAYQGRHADVVYRGTIITGATDASIRTFHLVSIPNDTEMELEPPLRDLSFQEMLEVPMHRDESSDVLETENGKRLVIERAQRMWSACVCCPPRNLDSTCTACMNRGHIDLVRSVCSLNGMVISGSYDGTVKLWDKDSGQRIGDLFGAHMGRVFSVVADNTKVVSAGSDCRIVVWDFAQGIDTSFISR